MVGFTPGVNIGVEVVGVGVVVGAELGAGEGVAKDESLVVVIAYIPESPHKFKELLANSRKPTMAPTLLFKGMGVLPPLGVEEKVVRESFIH